MRLEPLFEGETWYLDEAAWIYGERDASGFGIGDGRVEGPKVRGRFVWSNAPRRREDGTWLPRITGYIQTDEDERILVTLRGQSSPGADGTRDVTCWMEFRAGSGSYEWLNDVAGLLEGRFDPASGRMALRVFQTINEHGRETG